MDKTSLIVQVPDDDAPAWLFEAYSAETSEAWLAVIAADFGWHTEMGKMKFPEPETPPS